MTWGTVAIGARVSKPSAYFVSSLVSLIGKVRQGDIVLDIAVGMKQREAADQLVRDFLASKSDALLFLDDDMIFGYDALNKLRDDPRCDGYGVVSGLTTRRHWPPTPTIMRFAENSGYSDRRFEQELYYRPNEVIPVDAVGLAFTLVRRETIEAIITPPDERGMVCFVRTELNDDMEFSRRCRDAGYKLGVHTGVEIGHMAELAMTPDVFKAWRAAGCPPVPWNSFWASLTRYLEKK